MGSNLTGLQHLQGGLPSQLGTRPAFGGMPASSSQVGGDRFQTGFNQVSLVPSLLTRSSTMYVRAVGPVPAGAVASSRAGFGELCCQPKCADSVRRQSVGIAESRTGQSAADGRKHGRRTRIWRSLTESTGTARNADVVHWTAVGDSSVEPAAVTLDAESNARTQSATTAASTGSGARWQHSRTEHQPRHQLCEM